MGGPRPPRPKRDLTSLVRKLDLLTGDVSITLSDEQAASLGGCLADVEKAESMSDDDAQAKHEELLALLDEDQKSRLDAIGLPRRRSGGPGGPGGAPGGRGGPGGGPGGPGGGEQAEDANPFQEESNAQAITSLRERFGAEEEPAEPKPAEKKAESKPAEKKPAESKPAEAKAPEAKPAQAEPAEAKPAEKKPAEPKPAPAEEKPAEAKAAEEKPAES